MNQNRVIIEDNPNQIDQQLIDVDAPFGPIELSILERVENGLTIPDNEREAEPKLAGTPPNEKAKYLGPREVIFVSGWININSIYQRYLWGFASKILLGVVIIYAILYNGQNLWPVAACFCAINAAHLLKNLYFLVAHRSSHPNIKITFWMDLNVALGYLIYFTGYLLLFQGRITSRYLPLFSVPYLGFTCVLFFLNGEENLIIAQKKFQIFEGLQLLLIAMKFSEIGFINWNYTLIFFMAASIYLTVLGLLLTIILSCSLFGFLYRNLESWKVKSLIWMTWYYLWSGMVYIYFIKGTIQYYHEDDLYEPIFVQNYVGYQSQTYHVLIVSAVFLIIFSFVNLVFHLAWREDIKRYLTKIIYKNELRKEISLRLLSKSFSFQLIQVSATYFLRTEANPSAKGKGESADDTGLDKEKALSEKEAKSAQEGDLCVFCCETEPNIMIDPCGHGGICKKCVIHYLKFDEGKCPYCKCPIERLYVLQYDPTVKSFFANGEIDFQT